MCCTLLAMQKALVLEVGVSHGWRNVQKKASLWCCSSDYKLKQLCSTVKQFYC